MILPLLLTACATAPTATPQTEAMPESALTVSPKANGCFDISREPDPRTGGLRIPNQRVCPTVRPNTPGGASKP